MKGSGETRRRILLAGAALAVMVAGRAYAATPRMTVYRDAGCGCCLAWARHVRQAGYEVDVRDVQDLVAVKQRYQVPQDLHACHTAIIDGVVIEGHVPAGDIARFLAERPPAATGLAVPGMPVGSPGMEQGNQKDPYATIQFGPSGRMVFARH